MPDGALAELAARLPGRRVLVVGDVMLDEYLWGDATRLSAEAPVPVVEVRGRSMAPGGAGNAAANVVSLGGAALLAAVVGADEAGHALLNALRASGIDIRGVVTDGMRPTTAKVRLVTGSQQIVRMDHEIRTSLPAASEDILLRWAQELVMCADACILSDYGKGVVTPRVARRVIDIARDCGIPVVVDPKGANYTKYRAATILKPNVSEVERFLQEELSDVPALERAGRGLVDLLGGTAVLITRGPDGMALIRGSAPAWHVPAVAQEVYDVTDAGDTVIATVALALAAGAPLEAACHLANHAAGLAVACRGTVAVSMTALGLSLEGSSPAQNLG
jgi:D-beta-D-heptose 7-phosphate kinase/D-beta-D-heptose 1-phosphate adenosyltransferase